MLRFIGQATFKNEIAFLENSNKTPAIYNCFIDEKTKTHYCQYGDYGQENFNYNMNTVSLEEIILF